MAEKYRIVIADDEALICMDLREMLEEAGHEVVGIGSDGVEALDLVKEKKPDLVILDVKMPRLDGIQAARMIAHDNLAPVVLLTAFGDEDMIEKAKKSMVFGYVMKPVEEKTLFPAIQIAAEKRHGGPGEKHGKRTGCSQNRGPRQGTPYGLLPHHRRRCLPPDAAD